MLLPPTPMRKERILTMGPYGSGKTTSWFSIAKWAMATGSPAQFYVIDSDAAVEAFIAPGTQYAHLNAQVGGNVHVIPVFEWQDYRAAADQFAKRAGPEDWEIVDFASNAWEAVQDWFVTEMFKTDPDEFYMEARKAKAGGNPLDGWKDWQYINRSYRAWANMVMHRTAGHKFLTAQSKPIGDQDGKEVRALYGSHGVRPTGQKQLGHVVHTILYQQVLKPGEVYLTTIKDRERGVLQGQQIHDFTLDYLVPIAGWTL